jgi:GTP pyrophosphokinase
LRNPEPQTHARSARSLDERRNDRERSIEDVIARLRSALNEAGIPADLGGRPKHICGIDHDGSGT